VGYYLAVTGKLTADTGWGRRVRPLGPFSIDIAAPAGTVFDVIAAPYLGHMLPAMAAKLRVLERGSHMMLARHYTRARRSAHRRHCGDGHLRPAVPGRLRLVPAVPQRE
jgi:hypothetical protein